MWKKTHSVVAKNVTKEQMWKLFSDVNNWHLWDDGIEYAKMEGKFEEGNQFTLRPKGGPNAKIKLIETIENKKYVDVTKFPLASMVDEHILEETNEGLKFTNTISVTGILSLLWIKLVAQKIANDMPRDMQKQVQAAGKL